jgi:hypothetical protein
MLNGKFGETTCLILHCDTKGACASPLLWGIGELNDPDIREGFVDRILGDQCRINMISHGMQAFRGAKVLARSRLPVIPVQ